MVSGSRRYVSGLFTGSRAVAIVGYTRALISLVTRSIMTIWALRFLGVYCLRSKLFSFANASVTSGASDCGQSLISNNRVFLAMT